MNQYNGCKNTFYITNYEEKYDKYLQKRSRWIHNGKTKPTRISYAQQRW